MSVIVFLEVDWMVNASFIEINIQTTKDNIIYDNKYSNYVYKQNKNEIQFSSKERLNNIQDIQITLYFQEMAHHLDSISIKYNPGLVFYLF